jgi:hypothetical protein
MAGTFNVERRAQAAPLNDAMTGNGHGERATSVSPALPRAGRGWLSETAARCAALFRYCSCSYSETDTSSGPVLLSGTNHERAQHSVYRTLTKFSSSFQGIVIGRHSPIS